MSLPTPIAPTCVRVGLCTTVRQDRLVPEMFMASSFAFTLVRTFPFIGLGVLIYLYPNSMFFFFPNVKRTARMTASLGLTNREHFRGMPLEHELGFIPQ
jgi:hypothetical protein